MPDPELVATWLSSDTTRKKHTCYTCRSPDRLSTDCPMQFTSYQGPHGPECNTHATLCMTALSCRECILPLQPPWVHMAPQTNPPSVSLSASYSMQVRMVVVFVANDASTSTKMPCLWRPAPSEDLPAGDHSTLRHTLCAHQHDHLY